MNISEKKSREDNITNQRLTWAMAFQGFLIASVTFLIAGSWDNNATPDIKTLRKISIGAVGVVGFLAALITKYGIEASRNALDQVIKDWEWLTEDNDMEIVPKLVPRTYGSNKAYFWGTSYARLMPRLFLLMWFLYVITFSAEINFGFFKSFFFVLDLASGS